MPSTAFRVIIFATLRESPSLPRGGKEKKRKEKREKKEKFLRVIDPQTCPFSHIENKRFVRVCVRSEKSIPDVIRKTSRDVQRVRDKRIAKAYI